MLLPVDGARFMVLRDIDAATLLRSDLAVGTRLALGLLDLYVFALEFGGFAGGEAPVLNAFADPLLLRAVSLLDLAIAGRLDLRVMLLLVDLFREVIFLLLQLGFFGRRKGAIGLHALLLALQLRLLGLELGGFARGQRAVFHAL